MTKESICFRCGRQGFIEKSFDEEKGRYFIECSNCGRIVEGNSKNQSESRWMNYQIADLYTKKVPPKCGEEPKQTATKGQARDVRYHSSR